MRSINISKTLNLAKGRIEVRYNGITTNDHVDLEKIEKLLDDFITNHSHNHMIENVSIVRTILKDCEEKQLDIFYQDEQCLELVKYDNFNLLFYEKSKREGTNDSDKYKITYDATSGIKLDYNNNKNDVTDYPGIQLVSKEITEIVKQIYYLKNTKAVTLDINDKELIEIYKLFYDETPDFSSKDINIKVQTMMSILVEFGISLNDDYDFSLCGKEKIPVSLDLKQRVNKLYPLGKIDSIEDSVKFGDEAKKTIKVVGECVRGAISNAKSQNEALITISKVIHAGRYCLASDSDIEKLSEFTERNTDEVMSSIKLVKRIENKINK